MLVSDYDIPLTKRIKLIEMLHILCNSCKLPSDSTTCKKRPLFMSMHALLHSLLQACKGMHLNVVCK